MHCRCHFAMISSEKKKQLMFANGRDSRCRSLPCTLLRHSCGKLCRTGSWVWYAIHRWSLHGLVHREEEETHNSFGSTEGRGSLSLSPVEHITICSSELGEEKKDSKQSQIALAPRVAYEWTQRVLGPPGLD
jgi:hypothetical protein